MPKFRTHKIKHEHSIIPGLRPLLERLAACPAVQAITPGRISATRAPRKGLALTFQYETDSGLKLLAKGPAAIQEVFVVASDRAGVRRWLAAEGLAPDAAPSHTSGAVAPAPPTPATERVQLFWSQTCPGCGRPLAPGSTAIRRDGAHWHVRCARGG